MPIPNQTSTDPPNDKVESVDGSAATAQAPFSFAQVPLQLRLYLELGQFNHTDKQFHRCGDGVKLLRGRIIQHLEAVSFAEKTIYHRLFYDFFLEFAEVSTQPRSQWTEEQKMNDKALVSLKLQILRSSAGRAEAQKAAFVEMLNMDLVFEHRGIDKTVRKLKGLQQYKSTPGARLQAWVDWAGRLLVRFEAMVRRTWNFLAVIGRGGVNESRVDSIRNIDGRTFSMLDKDVLMEVIINLRQRDEGWAREGPGMGRLVCHGVSHKAGEDQVSREGRECDLCLRYLKVGTIVDRLPCGHIFHQYCLHHWHRAKGAPYRRCPRCKRRICWLTTPCINGDDGRAAHDHLGLLGKPESFWLYHETERDIGEPIGDLEDEWKGLRLPSPVLLPEAKGKPGFQLRRRWRPLISDIDDG